LIWLPTRKFVLVGSLTLLVEAAIDSSVEMSSICFVWLIVGPVNDKWVIDVKK